MSDLLIAGAATAALAGTGRLIVSHVIRSHADNRASRHETPVPATVEPSAAPAVPGTVTPASDDATRSRVYVSSAQVAAARAIVARRAARNEPVPPAVARIAHARRAPAPEGPHNELDPL